MRLETIALGLAIGGTVAVAGLGFRTTGELVVTTRDVDVAYRVIDAVDQVLAGVSNAGGARRAFLFDGDAVNVPKFAAASAESRLALAAARGLATRDASVEERIDRLGVLLESRLASLGESMERRRLGLVTGREPPSEGELTLMNGLRLAASEANGEERRLLAERQGLADRSVTISKWRESIATLFSVVLASLAFAGVRRENGRRRKSEDEARRARVFLDSVIENLPAMVFIKNADELRFERLNHAGEELLGMPRSELLGKNDQDLFPEEQAVFFREKDRQTLDRGVVVDIPEEPIETSRGQRWLHTRKVPLHEDGRARYLLGISVDITERKQISLALEAAKESAEAASRELESFAYSVAHDLRAPLRSIDGFSRALLEDAGGALDATAKGHLDRVIAAAQRMGILIDDVLDLSRVSRAEMKRESVNLSELARQALRDLLPSLGERTVDVEIQPSLEARADARLVRLIFDNLLGNAFKFTARKARATIEFGARTDGDERVYFVRDNGAGFDMQYAHKLFGVFQRLHSVRDFPGTGIGLATVQRVVSRHGGRIWAEGEIDRGATISFTLAARRDTADAPSGAGPSAQPVRDSVRLRI